MKNKKLLYVLIPAVLFVWGMIIYKIFAGSHGNDDTSVSGAEFVSDVSSETTNDTFSIHPDYRDPFSGKLIKKSIVSPGNSAIPVKKIVQPVSTQWPSIVYGGIIKNQKSNKQLVLIQVNGQSSMMKLGESFNDITLTKMFKDSIEVKFGKEMKYIRK